jgi:MFS family permease
LALAAVLAVAGESPAFQMVVREMSAMPPKTHRGVLALFALLLVAGAGVIAAVAPIVAAIVVDRMKEGWFVDTEEHQFTDCLTVGVD